MASLFESFVNDELPKRPATQQDPTSIGAGMLLRSTGVGLGVEFVAREDVAPDGKSAFELAKEAGFVGTLPEWIASLKGADGVIGEDGPMGPGIKVIATVTQIEYDAIVADGNSTIGDAYFVGPKLFVFNGDEWVESPTLVGPDGKGLNYLGTWPNGAALPVDAGYRAGDTYVWKNSLWTFVEAPTRSWVDIGVPGPTGMSAYESAIKTGAFVGTEVAWLASLIGKSAYQIAVAAGFVGNEAAWLLSLKGATAYQQAVTNGFVGTLPQWLASLVGKSAFEVAVAGGFGGTQVQWLATLVGPRGLQGIQGDTGATGPAAAAFEIVGSFATEAALIAAIPVGIPSEAYYVGQSLYVWVRGDTEGTGTWTNIGTLNGKSAYQTAVDEGFVGTVTQWLASLEGKTAYQSALDNGFVGNINAWLASLKGTTGDPGGIGPIGPVGPAGKNLVVLGTKANEAAIKATATPAQQDAYVASDTGNLWIYITTTWTDLGKFRGTNGTNGTNGSNGTDGASAYDIAKALNPALTTEALYLASLKGANGTDGRHVVIKGSVANQAALPAVGGAAEQDAYTTLDTGTLFMKIGAAWLNLGVFRGTNGTNGKTAYELAVAGGYVGTEAAWLLTLKGTNGTNGTNGTDGKNVVIKGVVANFAALPPVAGAAEQDAYVLRDTLHLWMKIGGVYVDLGTHQGSGIDIIASLTSEVDVPPAANAASKGKAYVAFNGDLFVNISGVAWTNVGSIRGTKGDMGVGLNIIGTVANQAALPSPATLDQGDTYFTADTKLMYTVGDNGQFGPGVNIQGPAGEEGPVGPTGATGTSISIMGSYATAAALKTARPTGNPGEGYLVGNDLYLYGVNPVGGLTEWFNCGPVRGPQGIEGPRGPIGLKGNTGTKGDRGTLWLSLPPGVETPTLAYGVDGDWAVNSAFQTFYRAIGTGWISMGPLVAGDVNSPMASEGLVARLGTAWVPLPVKEVVTPVATKQYVRRLISGNLEGQTEWVELTLPTAEVVEAPNDAKLYGRKSKGWVEVVIAVGEAPNDGKNYVRKSGNWAEAPAGLSDAPVDAKLYGRKAGAWAEVVLPAAGIGEAPTDAKLYGRKSSGWVEVVLPAAGIADVVAGIAGGQYFRTKDGTWQAQDRYDSKITTVTGGTSVTLNVADSQLFKIPNASGTTTITIGAVPGVVANRAMTVVLVISGNAGTLAWATTVNWNGGAVPTLGATKTVITLLWDGTGWIGAAGASY